MPTLVGFGTFAALPEERISEETGVRRTRDCRNAALDLAPVAHSNRTQLDGE